MCADSFEDIVPNWRLGILQERNNVFFNWDILLKNNNCSAKTVLLCEYIQCFLVKCSEGYN